MQAHPTFLRVHLASSFTARVAALRPFYFSHTQIDRGINAWMDGAMQARVAIQSISDRLMEMASEQGPVVLEHRCKPQTQNPDPHFDHDPHFDLTLILTIILTRRLTLHGEASPSVFEVVVRVPDPISEEVLPSYSLYFPVRKSLQLIKILPLTLALCVRCDPLSLA